MMNKFTIFILCIAGIQSFAQTLKISGSLQDTMAKEPLQHTVVMIVRLTDSLLVDFTRSNENGLFTLNALPVDTYQVMITHPKFSDMGFFIFGDTKHLEYDFGKIILQPKNIALEEVTIFAFKDPVYYKGDTLVYTADSFKTKANATVEDLLKKLPGLKVDKDGKITAQGKKVDRVFVDGDEFFGNDPTMATRNLNASSIESVQIYETQTNDANSSKSEGTEQILNLKLKEDAKKGYLGKVGGATDFRKFYEGEVFTNYFKNKLKLAVFGMASNTPNSTINWQDAYKYGLENLLWEEVNEDDDNNEYTPSAAGIPQSLRSGVYYSDRLSKKTRIMFNYTYNDDIINGKTSNYSQYFLSDTSYSTANLIQSRQKRESHVANIELEHQLDSLTTLTLKSTINFLNTQLSGTDETDFISSNNTKTRSSSISNSNNGSGYNISNNLSLYRKFKKKDRTLRLYYYTALIKNETNGLLKTTNGTYNTTVLNNIDQKKTGMNNTQDHFAGVSYIEPLTKKIKVMVSYDFLYYKNLRDKKSINNSEGEYTVLDSSLSNNFTNTKYINRVNLQATYNTKKIRFALGSKLRHLIVDNYNTFTNQHLTQSFTNLLPFSNFRYNLSESKSITLNYTTISKNPTISQLQPIQDNTNPNMIFIGNPALVPTSKHSLDIYYQSWQSVSGRSVWLFLSSSVINNDFANKSYYDSIGRSVNQTINVNGNYNTRANATISFPFFSKKFEVSPEGTMEFSKLKNSINNSQNITEKLQSSAGLAQALKLEKITAGISYNFSYNQSSSSLNTSSNKPYTSQTYKANVSIEFPKKIFLTSDAVYTLNGQRSDGYNINYLVWNASLSKNFFKLENLIVGWYAYDMLNQNIDISRSISSNIISDTKTNIISRYFLLKVTYKFNSTKTKDEDEFY